MGADAVISDEVLADYAADAAGGVEGVTALAHASRRHRGVRVAKVDGSVVLEVHIAVAWGVTAPDIGAEVQRRVAEYVGRTAKVRSLAVDVVISGISDSRGQR